MKTQTQDSREVKGECFTARSRVWPQVVAAILSGAASVYWSVRMLGLANSEDPLTLGVEVLMWLFLVILACLFGVLAYRSIINRNLIVASPDQITFFHSAWRDRSITLRREYIATIEVDTTASDNDGADVVVEVSPDTPDCIRESRVWNRVDNLKLHYAYGNGKISPALLGLCLNEWLAARRHT